MNIAVVVQELIRSEKSGVMFTSHPVTGEPLTIVEGSWGGLGGEAVVSGGSVSPDNYVFDLRSERVVDRLIAEKEIMIVPEGKHGTKTVNLSAKQRTAPVLSDAEVARLATLGKIAEDHYGVPQDVEWAIVGDVFFILQSRPITTIKRPPDIPHGGATGQPKGPPSAWCWSRARGASPGVASGRVVIVRDVKDTSGVKDGDILVTKMTNPTWCRRCGGSAPSSPTKAA